MAIETPQLTIPCIDLSPISNGGSREEVLKASQSLFEALKQFGFANVAGHGVSDELLAEAFAWSKKLFDLPHEDKMKAPHPAQFHPHRGYSAPGVEKVYSKEDLGSQDKDGRRCSGDLRKIQDFKESYEIGSAQNPAQPNIWLPEEILPGYQDFETRLYWEFAKTAGHILEAISIGLNLGTEEKKRLFAMHSGHNNQLRLLHYPQVESERLEQQVIGRMPAHRDWSTFTFLFQDDCGGLELQDPTKPGSFMLAKPRAGTCVLNCGDMLQRFTNGLFSSRLHRVTLPPAELSLQPQVTRQMTRERYSIPYFVSPDEETMVETLPSCVNSNRPLAYEPIRFADYGEWLSKYMYHQG